MTLIPAERPSVDSGSGQVPLPLRSVNWHFLQDQFSWCDEGFEFSFGISLARSLLSLACSGIRHWASVASCRNTHESEARRPRMKQALHSHAVRPELHAGHPRLAGHSLSCEFFVAWTATGSKVTRAQHFPLSSKAFHNSGGTATVPELNDNQRHIITRDSVRISAKC